MRRSIAGAHDYASLPPVAHSCRIISKLFRGFLGFSPDFDPAFQDHTFFLTIFVSGSKCPRFC